MQNTLPVVHLASSKATVANLNLNPRAFLVASSQFSNDSFITYLDQVFTSTTTPVSAFSKFSHTPTIGTSTTVASKTSDIFNSSSLSIVRTVAHK